MARKYRKDPITEMLCVFEFDTASPWDAAIPGLIYERVRAKYPKRRQVQQFQTAIETKEGTAQIEHTIIPVSRLHFLREDERALIQVGAHSLSFNHLSPYPGWPNALPMALEALEAYKSVAGPIAVRGMAMRYDNDITLPGATVDLEDYFEFYPRIGKGMEQTYGAFVASVEYGFVNRRDLLRVQLNNGSRPAPDTVGVRLTLEYALAEAGAVGFHDVEGWLDAGHARIEHAFEGCITDKARGLFEVVGAAHA